MTDASSSTVRRLPSRRALTATTAATTLAATVLLITGCASQQHGVYGVERVPPTPSVVAYGSPYRYDLYIHCGIRYANFAGRWWEADTPEGVPSAAGDNTEAYGTMTLLDATHARFQGTGVPTVDFHPFNGTPPTCS